ncbi:Ca2+:H+ antiporter [Synechococcus sp. A18-40]|nr:Ca2+:H+ antiporter [Synechococcus sp. A18-40]
MADQADRVAELIGQPYGTLVLTAAVMTIELALIASTMLTGERNPTLARDSMFSVVMIALTGVTGLCNLLAAVRRGALCDDGKVDTSQMVGPNLLGALTYFDLISTMCVLALVIPNFSRSTTEANFSTPVNGFVGGGPGGLRHFHQRPDGALQQPLHRTEEPDHPRRSRPRGRGSSSAAVEGRNAVGGWPVGGVPVRRVDGAAD